MNAEELRSKLMQGHYDDLLCDIYGEEEQVAYQRQRYSRAVDRFIALYGSADVAVYSAPGRTEIGGNHTDHQHGKVLAAAVNLDAIAIVKKAERTVKVVSDQFDIPSFFIDDLTMKEEEKGTSLALIKGVCATLKERGYQLGGFEAYVTSDVLIGAGLSSSAAFEVLIGTVISGLYNMMAIDPVTIAKAGQYAENVYFGKPCGLMDQSASAIGSLITIDFKNENHPAVEKIDVPFAKFAHALCITDTKGSHADLTDEYAAIPQEMKQIAAHYNKKVLGDVDEKSFYHDLPYLMNRFSGRSLLRAIHFFEENKRVDKEVAALKNEDFTAFLKQVTASGDSSFKYLQNVYANSDVHHQNVALALAISEIVLQGKGAVRVHGGGFAGTIQAFVPLDLISEYKTEMEQVFGNKTCHVLKIRPYGGIKVME